MSAQPPRVWWDGHDFVYLMPGPLLGQEGHIKGPGLFRARMLDDLAEGSVELVPATPPAEPGEREDFLPCGTHEHGRTCIKPYRHDGQHQDYSGVCWPRTPVAQHRPEPPAPTSPTEAGAVYPPVRDRDGNRWTWGQGQERGDWRWAKDGTDVRASTLTDVANMFGPLVQDDQPAPCDDRFDDIDDAPHWCTRPAGHQSWHTDGTGMRWRARFTISSGEQPAHAQVTDLRTIAEHVLDLMKLRVDGRPVSIGEAHLLIANIRAALDQPEPAAQAGPTEVGAVGDEWVANLSNCMFCGEFRGHGHECRPSSAVPAGDQPAREEATKFVCREDLHVSGGDCPHCVPAERQPPSPAESQRTRRLREYYDTHDTSAEMDDGAWEPSDPCTHTQHHVAGGMRLGLIELSPDGMQSRWESCTATGGIDPFLRDDPDQAGSAQRSAAEIIQQLQAEYAPRHRARPAPPEHDAERIERAALAAHGEYVSRHRHGGPSMWRAVARAVIKAYKADQ